MKYHDLLRLVIKKQARFHKLGKFKQQIIYNRKKYDFEFVKNTWIGI